MPTLFQCVGYLVIEGSQISLGCRILIQLGLATRVNSQLHVVNLVASIGNMYSRGFVISWGSVPLQEPSSLILSNRPAARSPCFLGHSVISELVKNSLVTDPDPFSTRLLEPAGAAVGPKCLYFLCVISTVVTLYRFPHVYIASPRVC